MSIFKETFQEFVFNQLKIREAILNDASSGIDTMDMFPAEARGRLLGAPKIDGSNLKNSGNITLPPGAFYTNTTSRQCVIRMSSGANLKVENNLLDVNNKDASNLVGEGLAIRYILEGGIPAKDIDFKNNRGMIKVLKKTQLKLFLEVEVQDNLLKVEEKTMVQHMVILTFVQMQKMVLV